MAMYTVPAPIRVYRAGSSSSCLEPKSWSWAGSTQLGNKVKI